MHNIQQNVLCGQTMYRIKCRALKLKLKETFSIEPLEFAYMNIYVIILRK